MSLLTDFEIENFRCFDTFKMHNIKRINLIGGMNNAGKTALLEALFFLDGMKRYKLSEMYKDIRPNKLPNNRQTKNTNWSFLFYEGRTDQFIKLKSKYKSSQTGSVYAKMLGASATNDFATAEKDEQSLVEKVSKYKAGAFLYTGTYINNRTTSYLRFKPVDISESVEKGLVNSNKDFCDETRQMLSELRGIKFISAFNILETMENISLFLHDLNTQHKNKLLSAFQLIEPTIEDINIEDVDNPFIRLIRKGEHIPLALSYFGDAMVRIAVYTISIINNSNSIFLLDEVENGIHYTNQPKFWAWLFDLATEFDVQIFATTHSREMIEAYAQTAIEKGMEEEAGYYALYRTPTTNQVKNHQIAVDTILSKLERNEPIRGERI